MKNRVYRENREYKEYREINYLLGKKGILENLGNCAGEMKIREGVKNIQRGVPRF